MKIDYLQPVVLEAVEVTLVPEELDTYDIVGKMNLEGYSYKTQVWKNKPDG